MCAHRPQRFIWLQSVHASEGDLVAKGLYKEPFTAMRQCPEPPPHTSAPCYTHKRSVSNRHTHTHTRIDTHTQAQM